MHEKGQSNKGVLQSWAIFTMLIFNGTQGSDVTHTDKIDQSPAVWNDVIALGFLLIFFLLPNPPTLI